MENVFSEDQAPPAPAPTQQTLPFAQARLKGHELDPLFFSDGKMLSSVREALRKSCGDSFAAFLLLDSINGMKTTPVLNVVAVQTDEQGRKIKGQINGRPVVVHYTEEDVPITWRDAVYDLDNDFWLIPMRSMIALKPEDEISIGDHVEVGIHSHPAVITDKHENNEYEYDLYTYKDDEGKVKTVEKVQLRQIDENPLRMLPKENDSIVKPKTAQHKREMPKFSIGDVVKTDEGGSTGKLEFVITSVFVNTEHFGWMYWLVCCLALAGGERRWPEERLRLVKSGGKQLPQFDFFVGDKVVVDGYEGSIISLWFDASTGKWRYTSWGSDGNYHFSTDDQIKRDVPDVYKDDTPVIATKTAASGGTGYGDYQEKTTDSSGSGVGGDVSSPHAPADLAPFDPEEQAKEGSPVPSQEYKKTLLRNRIIKDSVTGRKVDVLASRVVAACNSHMIKKAMTKQAQSMNKAEELQNIIEHGEGILLRGQFFDFSNPEVLQWIIKSALGADGYDYFGPERHYVARIAKELMAEVQGGQQKQAQSSQNVSTYNTTQPAQPVAPIHNTPVAGNPLGGVYQLSETQQDELDANVSENENVARTQFQQEQNLAQDQYKNQDQANDLQQVFQQQKIDESNRQQSTVAKKVEASKLKLIFGSEAGSENPASSSLDQIESDDDQTGKSSTDHGRKVFLHEDFSDENVQDSVSYPSQRQEVKPRY
jgi:hypothetical protein